MNWTKAFIVMFVGTAVGFVIWLLFFQGVHDFSRQIKHEVQQDKQQERLDSAVGAKPEPQAKILVDLGDNKRSCVKISSVDFSDDGGLMGRPGFIAYVRNDCSVGVTFVRITWQELSPDDTILQSGWEYLVSADELGPSQKFEYRNNGYEYIADPRIAKIKFRLTRDW